MELSPALPLVLVALTAGLARGFSGFGAALIFMPPASALVGPQLAATTLALVDIVLAAPMIPRALPKVSLPAIAAMLAGAVVTVPLGAWLLKSLDPLTLRWTIAGIAAAMFGLLASGWRYGGRPHPLADLAVGATSGLFSGIAQIGGPPVVAYWLGGAGDHAEARAKIIVFFAGSSVISLATYLISGLITRETVFWALVTGPAYGLGLFGGARLFGLASESTFRRASLALIALAVVTSLPVWR